jgi:CelD/BcsL family acetyltransferase involved in cellulose biosynthesis
MNNFPGAAAGSTAMVAAAHRGGVEVVERWADEWRNLCDEAVLEELFEFHQERWQFARRSGTFASTARRTFYFDLSCALLKHGNLEFWLLTLNGKTAAAQFSFRHGETVFLLQEGFDPSHSADPVGFILRGHVPEQLVAAGVRRYDFLFGQSEGKQTWVPELQHYLDIHFAKPGSRGSPICG